MATRYVRTFAYRDSLTDAQALEELRFLIEQFIPEVEKLPGVQRAQVFSGAGALRADLTFTVDMDHAGVYESALVDPVLRKMLARVYGAWELKSSQQIFSREITPQLLQALSSTG